MKLLEKDVVGYTKAEIFKLECAAYREGYFKGFDEAVKMVNKDDD